MGQISTVEMIYSVFYHSIFNLPLSSGVTLASCKLKPFELLMRLIRLSLRRRTSPAEIIRSVCFQTITEEPEKKGQGKYIVASTNRCYYSENQIFCFSKSQIVTCRFFLGKKLFYSLQKKI